MPNCIYPSNIIFPRYTSAVSIWYVKNTMLSSAGIGGSERAATNCCQECEPTWEKVHWSLLCSLDIQFTMLLFCSLVITLWPFQCGGFSVDLHAGHHAAPPREGGHHFRSHRWKVSILSGNWGWMVSQGTWESKSGSLYYRKVLASLAHSLCIQDYIPRALHLTKLRYCTEFLLPRDWKECLCLINHKEIPLWVEIFKYNNCTVVCILPSMIYTQTCWPHMPSVLIHVGLLWERGG